MKWTACFAVLLALFAFSSCKGMSKTGTKKKEERKKEMERQNRKEKETKNKITNNKIISLQNENLNIFLTLLPTCTESQSTMTRLTSPQVAQDINAWIL